MSEVLLSDCLATIARDLHQASRDEGHVVFVQRAVFMSALDEIIVLRGKVYDLEATMQMPITHRPGSIIPFTRRAS